MKRTLRTSLLVSAALMLAAPATSHALASRAQACPAAYSLPAGGVDSKTLCLINYERAVHRLAPLRPNGALARAAARHSQDMAARNYFSHNTLGGGSMINRIKAARYIGNGGRWAVGENLGWGTGALSTPGSIVSSWMRSPGHRKNILKPSFREIGIGVVAVGGKAIYTTDFGTRG